MVSDLRKNPFSQGMISFEKPNQIFAVNKLYKCPVTAGLSYAVGFLFAILPVAFKGPYKENCLQKIVPYDTQQRRVELLQMQLIGRSRKNP